MNRNSVTDQTARRLSLEERGISPVSSKERPQVSWIGTGVPMGGDHSRTSIVTGSPEMGRKGLPTDPPSPSKQVRFAIGMFIIAILFLGTSATIVSILLQKGLHDATGNSLVQLALTTSKTIDEELYERYSDLDILADLAMQGGSSNRVFDTLDQHVLDKLKAASDTFTWIGVADLTGMVRAAVGGILYNVNVSARPWFQVLVTTDQPFYMGDVHAALLLDKALNVTEPLRLMDIALPLYGDDGSKVAIFGSHLNSKAVRGIEKRVIGTYANGNGAELFIVGSDGLVQAPVDIVGANMSTLPTIKDPTTSLYHASQNRTGFMEEKWPDGKKYVVAYTKSGTDTTTTHKITLNWTILIRVPTKEAYTTMNSLLFTLGMAHVGFALLLLLLTYTVAHITTRPLVAIAIAADHIRKRSMIPRIPVVKGDDEIAILSSSLNALVSTLVEKEINLKGINQSLRDKVELLERMECQLRSSEEKWRELSENVEECFWIIERGTIPDEPDHYTFISTAYERMLGHPLHTLHPDPYTWLHLVSPTDKPDLQSHLQKIRRKPISTTFRITPGPLSTSPHPETYIWMRSIPVLDETGKKCKRIIGVFQDVTRQHHAEMESKHKTTWVRQVGHEIRNPLAATWTMVNLLLEMDLNAEQRDLLETIRTSNDTLLSLINSILDLSKLEAGEMRLEAIPFSLRTQIEDVLDLMAPQANKKGLRVGGFVDEDVGVILKGDPLRLRQIIINLFTNSVKFTKAGSVFLYVRREEKLEVEAGMRGGDGAKVGLRFEVRDTGIGIAAENIPKLFKEFAQAESNTSRMYGGTGLGLSIVRRLVNLMGGDVGIESEVGKGSVFSFTAQFGIPTLDEVQRPSLEDLRAPPAGWGDLNKAEILILSEWEGMRKVLTGAVTEGSGTAIIRSDIPKALEEFTLSPSQKPVITILDLWDTQHTSLIPAFATISPLFIVAPRERRDALRGFFVPGKVVFVPDPVKPRRLVEDLGKVVSSRGGGVVGTFGRGVTIQRKPFKNEEPLNSVGQSKGREKLRVMLVEDNPINQKAVSRQLQGIIGDVPLLANDGQMCLDMLEAMRNEEGGLPHIIFMDVCMPVLDGLGATRLIRQRYTERESPVVIVMTANALHEDYIQCMQSGADAYLLKPASKQLLR
ncbi:hypothetical protein HK097_011648, partial [Rhizophlyctis rosea]